MTIQQFENLSLSVCLTGLILYMIFILYRLGKDSGAGRYGMFVIYFSLGMGIFGFAAKSLIKLFVDV